MYALSSQSCLETELACEGDTVTWVASGADDYTWFGINGFDDPTEVFNPGYAATGTDISELTVAGLDNPVLVEVSGSIPYIIPGSGNFASCFTTATTNTNLSATASEFELPVVSPEFTVAGLLRRRNRGLLGFERRRFPLQHIVLLLRHHWP